MGVLDINHNGRDPLCQKAVSAIGAQLASQQWPSDRITVDVQFGVRVSAHSDTKIALEARGGYAFGEVTVFLNVLSMHQRALSFFRYVIPHELAHVMSKTGAESAAVVAGHKANIRPHDKEFYEAYQRFSSGQPKLHKDFDDIFDTRALRLCNKQIAIRGEGGEMKTATEAQITKWAEDGIAVEVIDPADFKKQEPGVYSQVRWLRAQGWA